ncbi:nucleoside deaminase [Longimicrobium sp.]|uniref:nucleoside deaminase n=1 Tax=Longimicrobium sp. TaxID=2029185 RepID=UPI002C16AA48|nr:nucleoside deaminase [Longimicrobium sp.]HSU15078.1 nucleoside deaminase [Longimicrobium sp.]
MKHPNVSITLPDWVESTIDLESTYGSDEEKMRLAVELSRQNVLRDTGGPFGAAVFERGTGRVVGVGVNSVVRLNNCTLHGEMVAFMMAQARLGCFSLKSAGGHEYELATSCDPCAMCLGATLWSGVTRVICGATRDDAVRLGFDEGPVFPESHAYLKERGIEIVHGVLRAEAGAVLELYHARKGPIYNG